MPTADIRQVHPHMWRTKRGKTNLHLTHNFPQKVHFLPSDCRYIHLFCLRTLVLLHFASAAFMMPCCSIGVLEPVFNCLALNLSTKGQQRSSFSGFPPPYLLPPPTHFILHPRLRPFPATQQNTAGRRSTTPVAKSGSGGATRDKEEGTV